VPGRADSSLPVSATIVRCSTTGSTGGKTQPLPDGPGSAPVSSVA